MEATHRVPIKALPNSVIMKRQIEKRENRLVDLFYIQIHRPITLSRTGNARGIAKSASGPAMLTERAPDLTRKTFHRFENFILIQAAEVKRQTDVGCADDFGDSVDDGRAGFRPAKNAAAVSGHGIVIEMSEYAPVGFAIWIEVESGECKAAPSVPMIENINARLGVTGADIGGIHNEHVLFFFGVAAVAQRAPILFDPRALDFVGGDPRQGHQVMAAPSDHLKALWVFIGSHVNRRMRFLDGLGVNGNLWEGIVLAAPLKFSAGPGADNDVQSFR